MKKINHMTLFNIIPRYLSYCPCFPKSRTLDKKNDDIEKKIDQSIYINEDYLD